MAKETSPSIAMLSFEHLAYPDFVTELKKPEKPKSVWLELGFVNTDLGAFLELKPTEFSAFLRKKNTGHGLPRTPEEEKEEKAFTLLEFYATLALCSKHYGAIQIAARGTNPPRSANTVTPAPTESGTTPQSQDLIIQFIIPSKVFSRGKADPLGSAQQAFQWIAESLKKPETYEMIAIPQLQISSGQRIYKKIFM